MQMNATLLRKNMLKNAIRKNKMYFSSYSVLLHNHFYCNLLLLHN